MFSNVMMCGVKLSNVVKCCFYKCDVFQCGKMCVDASKFAVMQLNV